MEQLQDLVLGLQHIGIPTHRYEQTLSFYQSLGFTVIYSTMNGNDHVAFLKLKSIVMEVYEHESVAGHSGAIDHVALDVSDIEAVHALVKSLGYQVLEKGIQTLPFFANGVRYFTIEGPNAEKVEFSQYL